MSYLVFIYGDNTTLTIKNITILGAGIMGRGIAHVSCFGGFQTVLYDIAEEMLESASAGIQKNYNKAVEKNVLTDVQAKNAVSKLELKQDLQEAVSEADFVIEAVPDKELDICKYQKYVVY